MVPYRYSGPNNLGEVIEEQMMHGDHIVRLEVANIRTSKPTWLYFRVTSTKDGKYLFGTTVAPDGSNTDIEPGKDVTIKFDVTPIVIEVG